MSKVLFITANPKSVEASYSLTVAKEFIEEYKKVNPNDEIINIDVYKDNIPLIDGDVFEAWGKLAGGVAFNELSQEQQQKVGTLGALVDQFVDVDKYVFVSPLWNFGIPPMLKAYIDTVSVAGKTFKYTESGSVGLLSGKKAVHIQARGGIYSYGPTAEFELGDRYIKSVLGFFGITDYSSVIVEGANYAPDKAEEIKNAAIDNAKKVAKSF
ncbi:FMN-dependent NADH-azoreductase [Clostridium folliculivorans]|uniref:FMN dependent NADH:quinone oxidoreductase n=1 Tax=Clostridium folliculivorans TaxID=2886038 RepID=A0A9W5Y3R0_9CLOT|nr:FMN-dependent NADH-azoreductase [Clostridium folliculivorans]GKU26002.1 FMN-dependent NADH-azoreductase 2 [Clostridium folliculivorans]GKU28088.1 FMN-dependent NADH-azoreductase 2 [Clostridium folliculivorans]